MPTTVSLINMKGGVGKTTLALNLASYAAQFAVPRLSVLAVDLDPQANLSQYLLGERGYLAHVQDHRPTTAELFDQVIPPSEESPSPETLTPSDLIVPVRPYAGYRLDLVPSRLELAWALRDPGGKEPILARFLAENATDYDLIVVDCAPTESVLTAAAYSASRYLIVPVRPEFLATVGFPMLARSLAGFRAGHANQSIDIAGIVFNGGSRNNRPQQQLRSIRDVRRIARDNGWHVFENMVFDSRSFPHGSAAGRPIFTTDYAKGYVKEEFNGVAEEFLERVGLR